MLGEFVKSLVLVGRSCRTSSLSFQATNARMRATNARMQALVRRTRV